MLVIPASSASRLCSQLGGGSIPWATTPLATGGTKGPTSPTSLSVQFSSVGGAWAGLLSHLCLGELLPASLLLPGRGTPESACRTAPQAFLQSLGERGETAALAMLLMQHPAFRSPQGAYIPCPPAQGRACQHPLPCLGDNTRPRGPEGSQSASTSLVPPFPASLWLGRGDTRRGCSC